MKWIEVATVADFDEPVIVIEYDGIDIAIFQLADGYYAIADECSHAEASLSEGEIHQGCEIECPLHGARFDIKSGKNLSLPAVVPVASYPVRLENDSIYIQVNES